MALCMYPAVRSMRIILRDHCQHSFIIWNNVFPEYDVTITGYTVADLHQIMKMQFDVGCVISVYPYPMYCQGVLKDVLPVVSHNSGIPFPVFSLWTSVCLLLVLFMLVVYVLYDGFILYENGGSVSL